MAGLVLRLAFGLLLLGRQAADARRARVPRARAEPRRGPRLRLRRVARDGHRAAVRPRARLSAVPRARSAPDGRARRRAGAREGRAVDRRRARRLADRAARAARGRTRAPASRPRRSPPSIRRSSGSARTCSARRSTAARAADRAAARRWRSTARTSARPSGPAPRCALAAAAGLTAGVAILVRPAMLFFLPLAALWLSRAGAPALAVALVVGRRSLVDRAVDGAQPARLRPVRAGRLRRRRDVLDRQPSARARRRRPGGQPRAQASPSSRSARAHPGLTAEAAGTALLSRRARATSRGIPVWWLGLLAQKVFYTSSRSARRIRYTRRGTWWRRSSRTCSLLPFAVAGARAWSARRPPARGALAAGASAVLVCLVFFPQERFRIPVIDPALIVVRGACACADRAPRRELTR